MPSMKKICPVCQNPFFRQRNPTQCYCHRKECQRFRKNQWRQEKRLQDPDYRENQRQAQHRWQQQHSSYWQIYRATHPEYHERNRKQQRQRDIHRRHPVKANAVIPDLAKSDALKRNLPILSGTYDLVPINASLLAKSDAFRVKITLVSGSYPAR